MEFIKDYFILFLINISLLILLIGQSIFLLWMNTKKRIKDKEIKEAKLSETLERVNSEKEYAKKESEAKIQSMQEVLNDFVSKLEDKNKTINKLNEYNTTTNNNQKIKKLKQSIILTNENWYSFRNIFDDVYPNFIKTLEQKLINITNTEIKISVLAKLQLTYSESAQILGVGTQAVRIAWYRMRNKNNLTQFNNLIDFINQIDLEENENQ